MFCEKCGSNVPDGYEFCMKCGNKIESKDNQTAVIEMSNKTSSKKKKLRIIIPAVVIVALTIATFSYFAFLKAPTINGMYYDFSYYDDGYYEFIPDKSSSDKGTYIYVLSEKLNDPDSGVWEIKNEKLIISDSYHKNDTLIIYKKYIYFVDYTYKCKVPDGKTFDLTCSLGKGKYSFTKNGTFTSTYEDSITTGTYERDGDTISVKPTQPTNKINFRLLIVEDGINNSAYYKK